MTTFNVPIEFRSQGSYSVEAENYEQACDLAEKKLVELWSVGSPTESKQIDWLGAEAEVDGFEIDLDQSIE
jgi:hypothetical protein